MKPKILLCLALGLSGVVLGCSSTAPNSRESPPSLSRTHCDHVPGRAAPCPESVRGEPRRLAERQLGPARFMENRPWGPATNGLQLSISVLTTGQRDNPEFEVVFRNTGEQDVSLNLGIMLANGKVQLPDRIRLMLMDGSGSSRELHYSDKRYPGVAGRMDDYVVPLRAGSIHTLRLRLDQFWSPATKEFGLKLKPGRHEVSARFQGDGAGTSNLDMAGMKLMNFWKGKLQSNIVIIAE